MSFNLQSSFDESMKNWFSVGRMGLGEYSPNMLSMLEDLKRRNKRRQGRSSTNITGGLFGNPLLEEQGLQGMMGGF